MTLLAHRCTTCGSAKKMKAIPSGVNTAMCPPHGARSQSLCNHVCVCVCACVCVRACACVRVCAQCSIILLFISLLDCLLNFTSVSLSVCYFRM